MSGWAAATQQALSGYLLKFLPLFAVRKGQLILVGAHDARYWHGCAFAGALEAGAGDFVVLGPLSRLFSVSLDLPAPREFATNHSKFLYYMDLIPAVQQSPCSFSSCVAPARNESLANQNHNLGPAQAWKAVPQSSLARDLANTQPNLLNSPSASDRKSHCERGPAPLYNNNSAYSAPGYAHIIRLACPPGHLFWRDPICRPTSWAPTSTRSAFLRSQSRGRFEKS